MCYLSEHGLIKERESFFCPKFFLGCIGKNQSWTFWCTSAEANTLCLSQTQIVGVTASQLQERVIKTLLGLQLVTTPKLLTSWADLQGFRAIRSFGGESYLSPHLWTLLRLNMGFEGLASHGLSMGRKNKARQDKQNPSKPHGFGTDHPDMHNMPCPEYEIFLFSWLGHPNPSPPMSTSR